MSVGQPFNIYREQLSSLYHGLALWDPKPVENLHKKPGHVTIGDVGYLDNGVFVRMFNVTLPWDDPSNKLLGIPEKYDRMKPKHFSNVRENEIREGVHCVHVSEVDNVGANTHEDSLGQMYQCRAQHCGALLSLPHKGYSKDVTHRKKFEEYIRDNVDNWFRWSKKEGLPVEQMEDLILVSGCTLVTSWATAAFDCNMSGQSTDSDGTKISLESVKIHGGGAEFVWRNRRGNVEYHNSSFDPIARGPLPQNQCIFIRGFRAKRTFFRTIPMHAAAEPLPDDPDNRREDQMQVTRIPDGSKYRDPLVGVLDYIVQKCNDDTSVAEDIIAIAHDDDLRLIEVVETLTADAVEAFLQRKQMPLLVRNGAAILHDPADNEPPISDERKAAFLHDTSYLNRNSSASKTRKKRLSISLSFTSPRSSNQPITSNSSSETRPSGGAASLRRPSVAGGKIGPLNTDDSQSMGSHIRGNLEASSAATSATRPLPPHTPPSPNSIPQTAITATRGLAPAAGFAMGFGKRAVDRIGRVFGGLGLRHNTRRSTSFSLSTSTDFRRNVSNVSLASHVSQGGKGKQRRTPNTPSGARSMNTLGTASTRWTVWTDPGLFGSTGPSLGTRLRGPARDSASGFVIGGLVFGRQLWACVQDTAIDAVRLAPSTSGDSQSVSPVLYERRLPALIIRCVEHLMKWGVEEEGLFRVSGRAKHVAKLRSEFDMGSDFDLLESSPGDLDPHAVASIFKTYLQELPEPILTDALNPYFEAAMSRDTDIINSVDEQAAPARSINGNRPMPTSRYRPSLRRTPTLALPNISGMQPPSQDLLNTFASLLERLPQENRDLLRTVIDLINFVAQRKAIRMPLSNLIVVLCPKLRISPPILRVLCEAESIWKGLTKGREDITGLDLYDHPNPVPESPTSLELQQYFAAKLRVSPLPTKSVYSTTNSIPLRRRKISDAEDVVTRARAKWAALEALERTSEAPGPMANPTDTISATHNRSSEERAGQARESEVRKVSWEPMWK